MAKKIGEILSERGLITPGILEQGLESQRFYGGRLGSLFVDMGAVSEKDLLDALCEQKDCTAAKAGMIKSVTKATLDLIPVKVAVRYQAIPLARDNRRLMVALTDPNDLLALDELAFITGCVIEPYLATERTILKALEGYYGVERAKRDTVHFEGLKEAVAKALAAAGKEPKTPPLFTQATKAAAVEDEDAGPADAALRERSEKARRFWSDGLAKQQGPAEAPAPAAAASEGGDEEDQTLDVAPEGAEEEVATAEASREAPVADGNALLLDDTASTMAVEDGGRTLEEASRRLARVEIRDDIADVILWCVEELFSRSALFIFQKSRTIGWTGQGAKLSPGQVRKIVTPVEEVSMFTLVRDSPKHYLGILPDTPANHRIADALGGDWPEAVLLVPFGIKGRALGCFYAEDKLEELQAVDLHLLFRLLQKAGLALELLLVRSKIVML